MGRMLTIAGRELRAYFATSASSSTAARPT